MVLSPVFDNSFLHEAIMIMTIISEIMIQISHFQNVPNEEFLKRSVRYSAAVLWNSLSAEAISLLIRFIVSKDLFQSCF
jgi:membrane protein CcdC involved in cytochrome C biogenesis